MRFLAALLRRLRPEPEWHPLPYEQAIRLPGTPLFRNIGSALTPDGELLALAQPEPLGSRRPSGQSRDLQWAGREVREMRREAEG